MWRVEERALRYVAIGDSLSEGIGDEPWPDGTPRGWTDRLADLLAEHHGRLDYANLAIRGDRAAQIRDSQVEPALALEPDIVTFTAGMNDLLHRRLDVAGLRATLVGIVAPFTSRGIRVLVVPIPDIRAVSPAARFIAARRLTLNAIYQDLADHHGMEPPAQTAGTIFEDPRAWSEDRLHLSPLGHERLAAAAADYLGVPGHGDWRGVPEGRPPRRTLATEAAWYRRYVGPWVGRRLTGRSSGDGITAKLPGLLTLPKGATHPR